MDSSNANTLPSWEHLRFDARLSQRYYLKRAWFLATTDRLINLVLLLATTAAAAVIAEAAPKPLGYAGAAADRAARLASAWSIYLRDMAKAAAPTDADRQVFHQRRHDIEIEEPPPLRNLTLICRNEQLAVEGCWAEPMTRLTRGQRLLAHLADIGTHPGEIAAGAP